MSDLIKYDAARLALAECKAIDEVKSWHDKAAAMQAYGRMAKDKTLEIDAAEIRIRAERRLGEILSTQNLHAGQPKKRMVDGNDHSFEGKETPTLSNIGISKDLSSRAQKLAAVPEGEFEAEVGEWRDRVGAENARVTTRLQQAGEREKAKHPGAKPKPEIDYDDENYTGPPSPEQEAAVHLERLEDAVEAVRDENESLRNQIAAMLYTGSDEEKAELLDRLNQLSKDNRRLADVNAGHSAMLDRYMSECAQLKHQCARQARQIKALEARLERPA
ncbi:MAG: hypothetical protein DDT20_01855 [Firmicutes bacterium]|nr:hypothetical protein [Bacillota bacterium]